MDRFIDALSEFLGGCIFIGVFIGGFVLLIAHTDPKKDHPQPYTYWEILAIGKHVH